MSRVRSWLRARLLRRRRVPWPVRVRRRCLQQRQRRRRLKTDPRWITAYAIPLLLQGRRDAFSAELRRSINALPSVDAAAVTSTARDALADAIAERTGRPYPGALPVEQWRETAATLTHRGWQQLQRVLGYCGSFQTAVAVYRSAIERVASDSVATPVHAAPDARLTDLIRGAIPVIVGKASQRLTGETTGSPIVRLNSLNLGPSDQTDRCDVLYLNSGQEQLLDTRILANDPSAIAIFESVRLFNVGSGSILLPASRKFRGGSPELPFGGALTGIRAIHDMLQAGAKSVHLVGFDFYLTAAIRKPNHEMCAQLGSAVIWGQLDWVQSLHRQGLVTADAVSRAVLEMGLEEYAGQLEALYSDWSSEITNV